MLAAAARSGCRAGMASPAPGQRGWGHRSWEGQAQAESAAGDAEPAGDPAPSFLVRSVAIGLERAWGPHPVTPRPSGAGRARLAQVGAGEEVQPGAVAGRQRPRGSHSPRGGWAPGAGPSVPLPQSSSSSSSNGKRCGRRRALVSMTDQLWRAVQLCGAQSSCGARYS